MQSIMSLYSDTYLSHVIIEKFDDGCVISIFENESEIPSLQFYQEWELTAKELLHEHYGVPKDSWIDYSGPCIPIGDELYRGISEEDEAKLVQSTSEISKTDVPDLHSSVDLPFPSYQELSRGHVFSAKSPIAIFVLFLYSVFTAIVGLRLYGQISHGFDFGVLYSSILFIIGFFLIYIALDSIVNKVPRLRVDSKRFESISKSSKISVRWTDITYHTILYGQADDFLYFEYVGCVGPCEDDLEELEGEEFLDCLDFSVNLSALQLVKSHNQVDIVFKQFEALRKSA